MIGKLLATTAFLLGTCMAGTAFAQEPIVLKFASAFPPQSKTNAISVPAFIKAIEEASEGTLKVEHYPGGTLGPNPTTQLKLVEDGVVDIAEVVASYTPGRFRELEMFETPFVFESTLEASLTAWTLYQKGLLSGFDNLELVGIAEVGPYYVHTSKEVAKAEDLAGIKLRAGGAVQGAVVGGIGGVAVGGMPAPQIAENISRGVIGGALMDMGNLYNFRIADAAHYHVVNVPLGNVAVLFPMNKAKYDSLPEKAKAALDKVRGEWFTTVLAENLDLQNEETLAKLKADDKHHIVEFSEDEVKGLSEKLSSIKSSWDTGDGDANLYQQMIAARDAVRASK
ncbi:TRAP transporter substrate-binding protein DctP [Arvimicrobium flavum]|uniref:TRAP transporter substrate-binding protein DctP n=1 Tax=Arvimicrobium flavum TaxID=3393320 RepID=UPI00237A21AC|nr:TRAP transporter substrate-binding protein DctP [Mesorhizobium shangrilense]